MNEIYMSLENGKVNELYKLILTYFTVYSYHISCQRKYQKEFEVLISAPISGEPFTLPDVSYTVLHVNNCFDFAIKQCIISLDSGNTPINIYVKNII